MTKVAIMVVIVVVFSVSPICIFSQIQDTTEIEPSILIDNNTRLTFYVGQNQNFTTIQDAVNHANNGDTIIINDGHYYEHISINKTLILKGDAHNTTIIDGNNSGNVVYITADGCTLEDLQIINSGSETTHMEGFTSDNKYYSYTIFMSGIWISSSSNLITDCTLEKNGAGIFIYEGKNNAIQDCYFGNNSNSAILGYLEKQTKISSCEFFSSVDILVWDGGEFINNYCYNTTLYLGYAKALNNTIISDDPLFFSSAISLNWGGIVKNNYCSGFDYGIYGYDVGDCVIEGNTCNNNSKSGIYFEMSGDISIVRNTCNSNGEYGIEVLSGYDIKIEDNNCKNNGQKDIYVDFRSINVDLENNTGSIDNGPKERNILCITVGISLILIVIIIIIINKIFLIKKKKKKS